MRKILLMVLAGVAVLALGVGTATAAGHLITSKQIKDHSIKYKDLRKNAAKKLKGQTGATGAQGVKGVDGKTGATGKDGAVGPQGEVGHIGPIGPQGPQGPQGPRGLQGETGLTGADSTVPGPAGPRGLQGETGPSGTANITVVTSTVETTPGAGATASCPEGSTLVGGGGAASGNGYLVYSKPNGANGWTVKVKPITGNTDPTAYAFCAAA